MIYAGRIHDSRTSDLNAIIIEENSIQSILASKSANQIFVYFSSCSIDDESERKCIYVAHKMRMEELIRASGSTHLIFRLPQIIALNDSENSLLNFLVRSIAEGLHFELWQNAVRNFIDIDDVYAIVNRLLEDELHRNIVLNIASPVATPVSDLVRVIEGYLDKKANYEQITLGSSYHLDIALIRSTIEKLDIDFGPDYLAKAIHKYYAHLRNPAPFLSVIVPTYNQEMGINEFYQRTKAVLTQLQPRFEHEILFVNDFSRDGTYTKLKKIADSDTRVKIINFARNFGNQIGITAGIEYCKGDLAIIIDDDLQDPPEIILDFIAKWSDGYKVVYGIRPKRLGVNPVFKLIAKAYYRTIGALSDTKIPNDTGDFRLVDKVVIEQLRLMKEENRYYRGMVAWLGFPQIGYLYQRDRRYAGSSNFTLKKYVNFALNGLTSFTDKPLYFSSLIGFVITVITFMLAIILLVNKRWIQARSATLNN